MGTILASYIIGQCSTELQDTSNVRWPQAELLDYLNDGQREIATLKPESSVVRSAVLLIPGTAQQLPSAGIRLLRARRNMGTNGLTPGPAVTMATIDDMDNANPNWHTDPASSVVANVMYDTEDPLEFWVYPAQPSAGEGYIEIIYGIMPADVALVGDPITLTDVYANPLRDYMLFRAFLKDAEYASDPARAGAHYNAMLQGIGMQGQAEAKNTPSDSTGPSALLLPPVPS